MSSEAIKKIDSLRTFLKTQETSSSRPENEKILNSINSEMQILNNQIAEKEEPLSNAIGSPYLPDQSFYRKEIVYNSIEETKWKEVKSYDETYNRLANFNLKKLNIF